MNYSIAKPQLASIGHRFVALLVDGLVLGLITGALFPLISNPRTEGFLTFIFTILYQWYFLTNYRGQTPGKMLMGIRVVKTDGAAFKPRDTVIRTLGYTLNWITLGIGWLLALTDSNHQGLHDRLAHTYVVRA